MAHRALGRLRGKTAPSDEILDRIAALRPTFRVHWTPWHDGAWYWLIANHIGSPVWMSTGAYVYERYAGTPNATPANMAGAELMLDGGYIVARFTDEEFGGDHMFRELHGIDTRLAKLEADDAAAFRLSRLKKEWELASGERAKNEAYKQYLDALREARPQWCADQEAVLKEAWPYYMRGAVSSVTPAQITPSQETAA